MATGAKFTDDGVNVLFNRSFKTTPTKTNPTRFGIGTGTTTPAVADTAIETPITAWHSASDYKDYDAGFPSFDETNKEVTVQGFVGASEANGNTITEYGDFNTDGTPILCSHIVFTGITKTASVQVFVTTTFERA